MFLSAWAGAGKKKNGRYKQVKAKDVENLYYELRSTEPRMLQLGYVDFFYICVICACALFFISFQQVHNNVNEMGKKRNTQYSWSG